MGNMQTLRFWRDTFVFVSCAEVKSIFEEKRMLFVLAKTVKTLDNQIKVRKLCSTKRAGKFPLALKLL